MNMQVRVFTPFRKIISAIYLSTQVYVSKNTPPNIFYKNSLENIHVVSNSSNALKGIYQVSTIIFQKTPAHNSFTIG